MQASSVFVLCTCIVLSAACVGSDQTAKWEYKIVKLGAGGSERTGEGAGAYSSIVPSEEEFDALGAERWELTASYLEMETSYPNFGNEGYVTGLQPNVRPQDVIFVFKRMKLEP